MTAWGSIELAVEAMRHGACDFVQKPWDNARLLETVRKQAYEAAERAARQRQAKSEIEIARNVQRKLLPEPAKRLETLRYAACCCPAGDVGGDYYDFFDMGDAYMGFLLADVSGKGMGAALLMAHLQAAFRSRITQTSISVASVVQEVNRVFFESTPIEHYSTLFLGCYEDAARRLRYVNAGHLPPFVVRASGLIERLQPTGTVLGLFPMWHSSETSVVLFPGDIVVAFSDGVVEAGMEDGNEFGEETLASLLIEHRSEPVERLAPAIAKAVLQHGSVQHDDITVLALQCV
jgi:sigma-B regulation protein RsbU (phosphoserine phosphatase)